MKKSFKHIFIVSIVVAVVGGLSISFYMLSQDIEPNYKPVEREISLENLSNNKDV